MATTPIRQSTEQPEDVQRASDGRPQPSGRRAKEKAASDARAAASRLRLTVPGRPRLAPGVRLAGQMQESAFENPPWLIEREGAGYVQVTELLYRIAEQCDGEQTLEQIAAAVSDATGRSVSADNVRQLVGTQLLAKGLIPTDDGKVVGAGAGGRSLLALSLRAKVIGPETLLPFARPLQVLLWPPLLSALVALSLLAMGWLFLMHGVAAGARALLYAPALMIVALVVTALGAAFHELGHASALSYGGGRPKGMGVGLYLVYPAFYTDVSDNYRLPRWARVRTDLAGVFFHLVFMLGLVGVYALTSWEPILIFVVLVLLDAFHQLLPLVRLDGYWTLADITGVPDFYSYMGAFVRRFVPGQPDQSARLPKLKWWGTLVFAAYMLFAVPLMLFSLFSMLRATPSLLATGWDSALKQYGVLQQAASAGDPLGAGLAGVQLVVLALPTAALIYSLVRFGRRVGTAVWTWSKPTPTRRVIGGLGTLAACALLVYLWAPTLPFGGGRSGVLYGPTVAAFTPIRPETRGTVFDALGAPQPAWLTDPGSPSEQATASASPGPFAAPSPPIGVPSQRSDAGSGSVPATVDTSDVAPAATAPVATPAATSRPTVAAPPVSAPTSAPAPPLVPPPAATAGASTSIPAGQPTAVATAAPAPPPRPAAPATNVVEPGARPTAALATPTPRLILATPQGSPAPR